MEESVLSGICLVVIDCHVVCTIQAVRVRWSLRSVALSEYSEIGVVQKCCVIFDVFCLWQLNLDFHCWSVFLNFHEINELAKLPQIVECRVYNKVSVGYAIDLWFFVAVLFFNRTIAGFLFVSSVFLFFIDYQCATPGLMRLPVPIPQHIWPPGARKNYHIWTWYDITP